MSEPSETRPKQPNEAHPAPARRARSFLAAAALTGGIASLCTTVVNLHVETHRTTLGLDVRAPDCRKRMMESFRVRPSLCKPDSIILGSSRTKMLRDLKAGDQTFTNMSCDDMVPAEFDAFIRFFTDHCGKRPETVILALDFFGSSKHRQSIPSPPKYYIDRTFSLIHWLGLYDVISIDTALDTVRALADGRARARLSVGDIAATARRKWWRSKRDKRNDHNRLDWYTKRFMRDANETDCLIPRAFAGKPALIKPELMLDPYPHKRYYTQSYGDYELDERNRRILRQLRVDHPDVEFVPLLTPVSNVLFTTFWDDHDLADELETYARMIVDELGEVTTFMDVTSLTSARRNWKDENHLLPQTADLMILSALGVEHPDMPEDFGTRLTPETIDAYFAELPTRIDELPRRRRSPRTDASLRQIDAQRLAEKKRPPGWHWNDCVALINPRHGMRIHWPEVQRDKTTLELTWTMENAIELRFQLGDETVAVERLQRPVTHYGLTAKRFDLPEAVQERGFDAIEAAMVDRDDRETQASASERRGGIGHLRVE